MPRNLDLTSLRSLVTIAETGGVTHAAGLLNLTQSAVSMQIKRLEEALDLRLLDRSQRRVTLTGAGEQLAAYARRMLDLNDEALTRLTDEAFEGEIVLGVPHDIVYPSIPKVLQGFAAMYPRVRVRLVSSFTMALKDQFARKECDIILTTEAEGDGETLAEVPIVWIGAPQGNAWRKRPLPLAFEQRCAFRTIALERLEADGVPWTQVVDSESSRTVEATVSADLAVSAVLEGFGAPHVAAVAHAGQLPDLPATRINLYTRPTNSRGPFASQLCDLIRQHYTRQSLPRDQA